MFTQVAVVKGLERREIIKQSLELVRDTVRRNLRKRQIIIKPNFVSTSIQLASSHVDQMRGLLDFLSAFYEDRVMIAEAACGDTRQAYKNFGYGDLTKEYNVELVDLNKGPFEEIFIAGRNKQTICLRAASLLLDKDNYIISAAKIKTHDTVVVSLSVKNMAMGCIADEDRQRVHQGYAQTNLNIAGLAKHAWPDLTVIDGFVGMEGNGPTHGKPVDLGIAIASTDALSADRIACEVIGVEFDRVGYFHYCSEWGMGEADPEKIEVLGCKIEECKMPFRLHHAVDKQYQWKDDV